MKKSKKKKKVSKATVEKLRKPHKEAYHPYTVEQLVKLLPDVGDRLMKTPCALDTDARKNINPKPCTVVEVNPLGRWYRVRFDAGYCECFKVP